MTASTELFDACFGLEPAGLWSSPGRVNLIGEHTDYNQGLVLPFAIDARAAVAVAPADDLGITVVSTLDRDDVRTIRAEELDPGQAEGQGWAAYVAGVVWAMRRAGYEIPGIHVALDSTVPTGAGLSSSAALECSVALALSDLAGLALAPADVAVLAQSAENDYVGVPCGLMDQMASAACTAGHALFFDVRSGTTEQEPFDPAVAGVAVMVIDTRVKHALTDGAYADRRRSCEQAAVELGVSSLREVAMTDLAQALTRLSSPVLVRRVRHVVTEINRVTAAVELLRDNRIGSELGTLMVASHASLRDDYEVSDPALDLAVDSAMTAGAIGARMTGGGFGGSAIAVIPADAAEAVAAHVRQAFGDESMRPPVIRTVTPSAGARRDR